MPAALERALKRKIAHKNWSEERKDAYVYGTLRKTGWTPSHQKRKERKMISQDDRIVKLTAINDRLDKVINFQYDDDEEAQRRRNFPLKTAATAGAVGGGLGGLYLAGRGVAPAGANVAGTIGAGAKRAYGAVAPAVKKGIGNILRKFRFNAETKTIEFAADPSGGMFGGGDPGIQARLRAGDAKYLALQRLRLKLAGLKGMGLHS
jgi:hypothetical protein